MTQSKMCTGVKSLTSIAAAALPGAGAPSTRLSEAQAVETARVFCRKIGQPVTTAGTATFAANVQGPSGHYWQPIWDVTFPGQAELEVVDVTGVIARYANEAYSTMHRDNSPAGEAIPQLKAILRAKDAMNVMRQRKPLLFWQASLDHYSDPPLANASVWSVRWYRAAEGVPYREQYASFSLDAQTGEIRYFVLMFGTAPLRSAVKVVSQQDAVNVAASRIISQGIEQEATHSGTKLEIITPDYDWNKLHGRPGPANDVRLAWVSTFVVDGHWREVYVDTEMGEILGGDRDNGPAGMHTVASPTAAFVPLPITPMLQSVRAVYVRGRDANGKWATKPLLKFGTKDQPHAVALLRKTVDFRKEGPAGAASQQIVLVSRSSAIGVYSYFPDTGLPGGNSDWAAVPDEFKTWVQRKTASASASTAKGAHR